MDALEFLKERKRMCNTFDECSDGCPVYNGRCHYNDDEWYEKIVATVEQWSKENLRKTRQSVFLEQYPQARLGDDGVLQVDPCSISASYRNAQNNCATMRRECSDCRREFWSAEVE